MHTNLIILAGGNSSRMKTAVTHHHLSTAQLKEANTKSKGLISIGKNGRPFLDFLLYNAQKAGYKNIFIVIGEQGDLFKALYGRNTRNKNFKNLNIVFATQYIPNNREKPLGTADAILQAVTQYPILKNESYTVCNSDNLYSYEALLALRNTSFPNAFISYDRDALLFSSERIARFALTKLDLQNNLLAIIEKPSLEDINNYKDAKGALRVSMNIFKFDGKIIYPYLKNCPLHPERNEKEIPMVLANMLTANATKIVGIPFVEHVPDLTSKEDIAIVKEYILKTFSFPNF